VMLKASRGLISCWPETAFPKPLSKLGERAV
jgi:hypothetical protein